MRRAATRPWVDGDFIDPLRAALPAGGKKNMLV
jgi:hypothetical protein